MTIVTFTIATGNDNALQSGDGGVVTANPASLEQRNNTTAANKRHAGMRFKPPNTGDVPVNAIITSATLYTTSAHSTLDDALGDVFGHDVDSTNSFEPTTGDNTVDTRTRTTATAEMNIANAVIDTQQATDVTAIVQEIVNRSGWDTAYLTLLVIARSTGSERYLYYSFSGTTAPTLVVDWTIPHGELNATLGSLTLSAHTIVGPNAFGSLNKTLGGMTSSAAATVSNAGGATAPTIALNTPDNTAFGPDLTPTLEFTGSDADNLETLEYEIQISTDNTFNTSPTPFADATFTGGSSLAIHPNALVSGDTWTGEIQVDDRPGQSFLTNVGGQVYKITLRIGYDQGNPSYPDGDALVRLYHHQGTYGTNSAPLNPATAANTPTPDWITLTSPLTWTPSAHPSLGGEWIDFFFPGGVIVNPNQHYVWVFDWQPNDRNFENTIAVSGDAANSGNLFGGNTWIDGNSANYGVQVTYDVWFTFYLIPDFIYANSAADPGFVNTENALDANPFRKNQKISYTVQRDLMDPGTYYWRVRVKDVGNSGTNTWSAWSTARTFTVRTNQTATTDKTLGSLSVEAGNIVNTSLTPADTSSATTIDSPTLTQVVAVTPQDQSVVTTLDSPTLSQVHSIQPNDHAVASTLDSPALTQAHTLAPNDTSTVSTLDSPALTQVHALQPNDHAVVTTIDSPTLVQNFSLQPNDLSVATTLDSPTVIESTGLFPNDQSVVSTLDSPTITQVHNLSPNDQAVVSTLDSPALTQAHSLAPNDTSSQVTIDSPTVVQVQQVVPQDTASSTTISSPTLTQVHSLAPDSLSSQPTLDAPAVTQVHSLAPADLSSVTTLDSPQFSLVASLQPNDLAVSVTIDSPTIVENVPVVPSDTSSQVTIDSPALTQSHALQPNDLSVSTTIDNAVIIVGFVIDPDGQAVVTSIDSPTLYQSSYFYPDGQSSVVVITSPTLVQKSIAGQYNYVDAGVPDVLMTASVLSDRYDHYVGLVARVLDTNNLIVAYVVVDTGQLKIDKIEAGVVSNLATTSVALSANTAYTLQFSVNGSALIAVVNGTVLQAVSTFNAVETKHGVRVQPGTQLDDFKLYVKEV